MVIPLVDSEEVVQNKPDDDWGWNLELNYEAAMVLRDSNLCYLCRQPIYKSVDGWRHSANNFLRCRDKPYKEGEAPIDE